MAEKAIGKFGIDMTTGPFFKKIVRFALPLMLTGLLQMLYNAADIIVVGRYAGKESLAAVGATGALVNLVLNIFLGLSLGSGVMAARHIGAGDNESNSRCTHCAMSLSIVSGIIVAVFGFFASRTMLVWMDSPSDVLELSTLYLKIYFLGAPASLIFNFGASIVRATGDTRRPLYILTASGLLNVALNLLLVIKFGMGVAGVAIATVASQVVSAVAIVIRLTRLEGSSRLIIKKMRFYTKELKAILFLGVPAGFQNSLFSISNVIVQTTVNGFGSVAMAGISAGSNYDSFIYTCTNAFSQTTMTFTSQNVGAGKNENIGRVYRYCLSITAVIGVGMSLIGYLFSKPIVGIFSTEADVIAIGAQRLALVMPFYVFCSMMDVSGNQLRGMGRSVEPMIMSLLGACGLRLLWIYTIFPLNPTLNVLYWSYPISWVATFAVQFGYYFLIRKHFQPSLR